ncbi:MAG TPA: twin-arginine translocase TatA/TatE family subunit [Roseiflexaceae bacterium]|nr:twin-arginine translocase TatA/TatE family subunit [Roseiflexaceae bacterium]
MNFLGIGPGEIFLILILLLVVVGPERLPEFARQAGKFVIRVRDWIARSPDAQMVLRAREEIEQELQEIRRSLTEEVETVRKELESVRGDLAEAARMVEESADAVAKTPLDLDARAGDGLDDAARTIAPPGQAAPAAPLDGVADAGGVQTAAEQQAQEAVTQLTADRTAAPHSSAEASAPVTTDLTAETQSSVLSAQSSDVNGQPVPRRFKPGQAPPASATSQAETEAAVEELSRRIQALGEEFSMQLQALTAELQALRERQAARATPPMAPIEAHAPAVHEAALPRGEPAAPETPIAEAPAEGRRRCKGMTRGGTPCAAAPLKGQEYCRAHAAQRVLEEVA